MNKRIASAAAVAAIAAVSLTGCSKDDAKGALDKGKAAASQAANSKQGKDALKKAKDKASSMMNGGSSAAPSDTASGAASPAATGATVDLGKFAGNKKAKIVGAFYTKRRDGKPGPFLVTVTGVKANKVAVCVGPKGTRSQAVVVAKGKVKGVQKGSASCA
ncbi:hypothetical protein [Nocardioides montaniterrae]